MCKPTAKAARQRTRENTRRNADSGHNTKKLKANRGSAVVIAATGGSHVNYGDEVRTGAGTQPTATINRPAVPAQGLSISRTTTRTVTNTSENTAITAGTYRTTPSSRHHPFSRTPSGLPTFNRSRSRTSSGGTTHGQIHNQGHFATSADSNLDSDDDALLNMRASIDDTAQSTYLRITGSTLSGIKRRLGPVAGRRDNDGATGLEGHLEATAERLEEAADYLNGFTEAAGFEGVSNDAGSSSSSSPASAAVSDPKIPMASAAAASTTTAAETAVLAAYNAVASAQHEVIEVRRELAMLREATEDLQQGYMAAVARLEEGGVGWLSRGREGEGGNRGSSRGR